MSKRKVWVIEGRRKNRLGARWCVQSPEWSRRAAFARLLDYRNNNPRHEFRVAKYVPEKP